MKNKEIIYIVSTLILFGPLSSEVSRAETYVSNKCREAINRQGPTNESDDFNLGDAVESQALKDLEANTNYQQLSTVQQNVLKSAVKSTSGLLRVLQNGAEYLARASQNSANSEAAKLASRPKQMNPEVPLKKREKFWRENIESQKSAGRSLREWIFGTKFENTDLTKYFEDKDLVDLMNFYFFEHFMNDIYATEYKHATSWSRSTTWSSVITEFSRRNVDDTEFIEFVRRVFSNPKSRDAFLITRNVNPYEASNKINIDQSLLDDALDTFMSRDNHVKAKQSLIEFRLANLPKDQDNRPVVEKLLQMAVERSDAMSFVYILNRATVELGLEFDLANIQSKTDGKWVRNSEGTSDWKSVTLQESIQTRISDLELQIAKNQDSSNSEVLKELQGKLKRLEQFEVIFNPLK